MGVLPIRNKRLFLSIFCLDLLAILLARIFHIQETYLTDRLDEVVVTGYILVGLAVLYRYHEELKNYRDIFPLLILGSLFMFLMIVLDAISNSESTLFSLVSNRCEYYQWTKAAEDGFKILAEGVFLSVSYDCLGIVSAFAG